MLVYSSQWNPPDSQPSSMLPTLHTKHHPAAFLCTTEPALQVLLVQAPSHGALDSEKNLKYQGLDVTKKKKQTARHRQVSQSRTLLKQKKSIF